MNPIKPLLWVLRVRACAHAHVCVCVCARARERVCVCVLPTSSSYAFGGVCLLQFHHTWHHDLLSDTELLGTFTQPVWLLKATDSVSPDKIYSNSKICNK